MRRRVIGCVNKRRCVGVLIGCIDKVFRKSVSMGHLPIGRVIIHHRARGLHQGVINHASGRTH